MSQPSKHEIRRAISPVKDLKIKFFVPEEFRLEKRTHRTLKAIHNAWVRAAAYDGHGCIWVSQRELHNILRTTKDNARYLSDQMSKNDKLSSHDGVRRTYIRGSAIAYMIDYAIVTSKTIGRERYAQYSESRYRTIRDHETVFKRRRLFHESNREVQKYLKTRRIAEKFPTGQIFDELTKSTIPLEEAEFSHIRSSSMFPEIAGEVWNGLIVHQDTHEIITQRGTTDEKELNLLCKENKWNTRWHAPYVRKYPEVRLEMDHGELFMN